MNNSYVNRDCPPLMSDGRFVTDYRPSCEVHSAIRYHNNLYDSNQFRQFLINNGDKLREMTAQHYINLRGCNSCQFVHPDPNNNDTFWSAYRKHLYGQDTYEYKNQQSYISQQPVPMKGGRYH